VQSTKIHINDKVVSHLSAAERYRIAAVGLHDNQLPIRLKANWSHVGKKIERLERAKRCVHLPMVAILYFAWKLSLTCARTCVDFLVSAR
jgi:hypothetical protein